MTKIDKWLRDAYTIKMFSCYVIEKPNITFEEYLQCVDEYDEYFEKNKDNDECLNMYERMYAKWVKFDSDLNKLFNAENE